MTEELTAEQLWIYLRQAPGSRQPHNPERIRNEINRRRLAKGLPPMRPHA